MFELNTKNDVPNYLKEYIKEQIIQDMGHDGVGYHDWNIQDFIDDLKNDRIIEIAEMIYNDGDYISSNVQIPNNKLPLKFSLTDLNKELQKMFPNKKDLFAASFYIKFPNHNLNYYWASECYNDIQWRYEVVADGFIPLNFTDDSGDASGIGISKLIKK
jgi:hypothetical protein